MTTRQQISATEAPAPAGAYSQGIVVGGLLYTAGMGGHDPNAGAIVGQTVAEQTSQVTRNLTAVLGAHGLTFANVVKATAHLANLQYDFAEFNTAYAAFLEPPYPVRTTVGSELGPDMLVEIDMVAAAGKPD